MDPNATLRLISALAAEYDGECYPDECEELALAIQDACSDLQDWLDKGGHEPDWDAYPRGRDWFHG